jgi:medium-chain acyl-[acyl-carrier-protein] hydrolase
MFPVLTHGCVVRSPCPLPRARLICFPFAGGSAATYSQWQASLPRDIEVCAVELPGRGRRRGERCVTRMERLVDDLCSSLEPLLDAPYFLFGHSMGAVIAFSLARRVRALGLRGPDHLFASAHLPPHRSRREAEAEAMNDTDVVALLRRIGGTPPEILADPAVLELVVPIIRADLLLLDSYRHVPDAPLDCPITAFAGSKDEHATHRELQGWATHTTGPLAVEVVEGGHFFVNTRRDHVLRHVSRTIAHALDAVRCP